MQSVVAVALDVVLFVVVPWMSWRLLRRRIPYAVLPIMVGMLLAVLAVPGIGGMPIGTAVGQKLGLLGVLLLAFTAGMETRLIASPVEGEGATSVGWVRLFGSATLALLLPFIAGTLLAWAGLLDLPGWTPPNGTGGLAAVAIGLCLAVSALPVLVGIVRELKGRDRWLGNLALRLAVIDDAVLWSGLALLLLLAGGGQGADFSGNEALAVATLAGLFVLGRMLKRAPSAWLLWPMLVAWLTAGAWASTNLGLHELLGAYFAGAVLPLAWARRLPVEGIGAMALFVLAPLFFGHGGLRIEGGELGWAALLAAAMLLLVAAATKLMAVRLYPPLAGLSPREVLAVGALLQCKGLMEIVAAAILRDKGLLSEHAFAVLVTLAVISTLLTSPLFRAVVGRAAARPVAQADIAQP